MNLCVSLFIISVFVSASSSQSPLQILQSDQNDDKPYAFEYAVKDQHDRTQFGRREQSDGNKVQGVYSVNLPDGRQQTVQYEAEDSTGFKASVTYEGNTRISLNPERADKTISEPSKMIKSSKSSNVQPIPVPVLMSMPNHKQMIILKRPSVSIKSIPTSIKREPTSKPSMIQNMLSSIKKISEDFSDNMKSLNQDKPQRPNPKPISNGMAVGQHPQLTIIKPVASKPSMSVSLHSDKPMSIKGKPTSKPSMIQNMLSSIKKISDDFSENMKSLNQNKPQRPNLKPVSSGTTIGQHPQLTGIKPVASKPSLSFSQHNKKPTSIKTKPASQPSMIQNIFSSIKQFSDDFSENMSSLSPNKPQRPNPKPTSSQLPVIKPFAPELSLSTSEKLQKSAHPGRKKRSTPHGSKHHSSLHLPSVYNINTERPKNPGATPTTKYHVLR